MLENVYVRIIILFIVCSIIWYGIYFLCRKAKIRKAEKNGIKTELKWLRLIFIGIWLMLLFLFVWFCLNFVSTML